MVCCLRLFLIYYVRYIIYALSFNITLFLAICEVCFLKLTYVLHLVGALTHDTNVRLYQMEAGMGVCPIL